MPEVKNDVEALLDEHRACLELLTRVENRIECEPEAIDAGALLGDLRRLDETLRKHFRGEEEGFLSQLPIEQPWLATNFERLEKEHETILESLVTLIEQGGKAADDDDRWSPETLKVHVRRFILTMRRHEAEENELVMDAHWFTLGNID